MKKSTIADVGIAGKVYKLWPPAGQQLMGIGRSASEGRLVALYPPFKCNPPGHLPD